MKAKDLVKILQSVHPESEVFLGIGTYYQEDLRMLIAKSQIAGKNDPLNFLEVKKAVITDRDPIDDEDTYGVELILDTYVYPTPQGLWDDEQDFDRIYIKQEA